MRFARGPFWLGSISNDTCSPPASESKLTLESSPVRWKKYSRPSSAAMNPNPRSETSFLMVPVGISNSSSRKTSTNARPLSRRTASSAQIAPVGATSPPYHGVRGLPLGGQEDHSEQRGGRPRELERGRLSLPQAPDAPDRDRHDGRLTNGGDDRQRREVQGHQDQQVRTPADDADRSRHPPGDRLRRVTLETEARRDPECDGHAGGHQ